MSHKATEGYSALHPVPKISLKSVLDPSGATEAKAKRLVGEKPEDKQQNEALQSTKQMEKGKEVQVRVSDHDRHCSTSASDATACRILLPEKKRYGQFSVNPRNILTSEKTVKHGGDGDDEEQIDRGENILSMDFPPPGAHHGLYATLIFICM